jgi:hypothetical protein
MSPLFLKFKFKDNEPFFYLGSIKELIQQYSLEARAGQYELSRALADFSSNDDNALNFRRGDIIAIVPREDAYTQRGWLYGVKVWRKESLTVSVGDPDPQDPHVSEPPGSGSGSGFGSFPFLKKVLNRVQRF